jgi:hypothetical protein
MFFILFFFFVFLQMPSSDEKWLQVARIFKDKWQFPHCIGAVGGRHCSLQAPTWQ